MKVLMFGWEFPPFKSGGLGTACYDLTKGLAKQGVDVTFVMPKAPEDAYTDFARVIGTNNFYKKINIQKVDSILTSYTNSTAYSDKLNKYKIMGTKGENIYGDDLYKEVERFSLIAASIADDVEHDVIHAHDWMAYKAGMIAKQTSGKPLVCHIHATEFDRTGGNPNHQISHIEYEGLIGADIVIANSNYTKNNIMELYNIPEEKIRVVHFGIDPDNPYYNMNYNNAISNHDKIVLYLGRVTVQKGPDYFIKTARKVLDYIPNTKFVFAGNGDMYRRIIDMSVEYGISKNILFTGFLTGEDVHKAFQMADLYVMPSVSEPYGLVALESLKNGTPVLISKQSGVSEVITNALKVDFWDIDEMTNKIVASLKYNAMYNELRHNTIKESSKFNLEKPAKKTIEIYNEAVYQAIEVV